MYTETSILVASVELDISRIWLGNGKRCVPGEGLWGLPPRFARAVERADS